MRSQKVRDPPFGAGIAHTRVSGSAAIRFAKTPKPEPAKAAVTSWISNGLRRSGLSEPKAFTAAENEIIGKLWVTSLPPPYSSNSPRSTGSTAANTSSCVTKLISMSSW